MKRIFTKEVKIGLCVLVALCILFFGINYLKGVNIFKAANYYYASFENVEGLTVSSPVTLDGFKVGLVREISYEYDNPGHVKVEMSLDRELALPQGTKAVVASDILGTATIVLHLGTEAAMVEVGGTIPGVTQPGMLDAVSSQLMPAVSQIFPKIDTLLTTVNALMANPALQASITRLDAITADLQATTANLSLMARQMAPLPGQIAPILTDVKGITTNVNGITSDVNVLTGKMREMPIEDLLANLQATSENLKALTAQLNDPDSSLGQMMHNPELYNNINHTVASLDSLFIDIKRNPKRYVSIKVF